MPITNPYLFERPHVLRMYLTLGLRDSGLLQDCLVKSRGDTAADRGDSVVFSIVERRPRVYASCEHIPSLPHRPLLISSTQEPSLRYQGCQRASIVGSEFCQMNPQPNEDFMPPFTLFALTHDQLSGGVSRVMPSRTSIPSNYGQVSVIDG